MSIAIRYCSRTGNTKKLALAIAEALGVEAKEVSVPLEEKTDLVFLGSAVYAAGVDDAVKAFLSANKDKIGTLVNVSTAALLPSTYSQIKKLAAENGISLSPEEYHCRGRFSLMHRDRPNADDLKAAQAFARRVADPHKN